MLDPAQAALCTVEDLSRAHAVHRVHAPGLRVVVKLADRGPMPLTREAFVYRMTAWCPQLAAVTPRVVAVEDDVVVLEDCTPPPGAGPAPADAPAVGRLLGAALGRLHRATTDFPLPVAPPPFALGAVRATGGLAERAHLLPARPGTAGELHLAGAALLRNPAVLRAARELDDGTAVCLVHHDVKWDNLVLTPAPDGTWAALLVDWELAGLGDPAVDLGWALAEHLARQAPGARPDDGARALLTAYRDAARPAGATVDVLARRTVLAAALRLGQMGVEQVSAAGAAARDAAAALMRTAGALLETPDDHIEEVRRCLT